MSIADIILSLITWIFQKLILPVIPTNLPLLSHSSFVDILNGTLQHNLIYSFSGLAPLFNLKLLFILLSSIIFAEIIFWLVRAGFFIVKLVRG
jgi:hypothetical protein